MQQKIEDLEKDNEDSHSRNKHLSEVKLLLYLKSQFNFLKYLCQTKIIILIESEGKYKRQKG